MSEVVREVMKLVSEGEKLTDGVADAYQANDNMAYTLAAQEIIRRAAPFHLTALLSAASEAEKLGLALQQSKSQDPAVLEARVDHIINIANQFDRLQTFLRQQKITSALSPHSSTTSTSPTSAPATTSPSSSISPATSGTTSSPTPSKAPS